jgi:hypothetical protein
MDERARPTSSISGGPLSPAASFCCAAADNTVVKFLTSEVPEQWLLDDDDLQGYQQPHQGGHAAGSSSGGLNGNPPAAAAATPRGRGRRPLPRSDRPVVSHVEAERQRRDKLHRRFCDLRAVVPTVSRMDKASLLADATSYITKLRARVEQLEIEAAAASSSSSDYSFDGLEEKLEVRMVGSDEASLRLTTSARHAPARLMGALRSLDLDVQHASVCRLGGVTVQDAVVDVPPALRNEGSLRASLLHRLQQEDSA